VKTYQINVNDREYTVQIDDPYASPVTVKVNGKAFRVQVNEPGDKARPAPQRDLAPDVDETYIPVVTTTFVETPTEPAFEADVKETAAPAGDVESVIAPMPGKIMDIVVKVGDKVNNGDILCNLEAMKMKSPIRSTAQGTIAEILISEGQNVNYGTVLFTLG
jgi:biotin carboxyl carrier protein